MRIFIVARGYPTATYKMNGIFELDQAKALRKMGHEVVFLALDLRSIRRKRKWGLESTCIDDIVVEAMNLPCGKIPDSLLYFFGCQGLKKLFAYCLKKYGRPDIVHSHFADISYITIEALKKERYVKVITEHSSAIHKNNISNKNREKYKKAYTEAAQVVAVSNSLASVILAEYDVKSRVIPNIVNIEELYLGKNADGSNKEKEKYSFVSIGRLTTEKGMVHLVKTFASCFCEDKDTQLIIIGDGVEKIAIQEIIQKSKMETQILLCGVKSRSEIGCILNQCDCFVLASESETFGVVYAEAMAFGIPVIGTRCGGPVDFIDDDTGILIDVNDEKGLREALCDMRENSAKKYNKDIIIDKISRMCSEEAVGNKLENLYKELLEKRSLT